MSLILKKDRKSSALASRQHVDDEGGEPVSEESEEEEEEKFNLDITCVRLSHASIGDFFRDKNQEV